MKNELKTLVLEPSLLNLFKQQTFSNNKLSLAVISLFPLLFVTKSIEASLIFGIVVLMLMLLTSLLISGIKNLIPNSIKLPALMISLLGLAILASLLLKAFIPNLVKDFEIYIILLGVSPLLYINAFFADAHEIKANVLEAIGTSLGVIVVLIVTAIFREILGTGAITIGRYLPFSEKVISLGFSKYAIASFVEPYGALIVFGLILAAYTFVKQLKAGDEQ